MLFAWPAAAQEQRGSIEGVVKDSSGAVLPGVTVTAETGSGVKLDTTSDGGHGSLSVGAPGMYKVSANLAGFKPAKVSDVEVRLGSVKKVEFNLSSRPSPKVTVTAESPIVDVKQAARQPTSAPSRFRCCRTRATSRRSSRRRRASTRKPSRRRHDRRRRAAENRYVIDGIETTNIVGGLSGQNLLADFVEEVQVKSTGYPAEFGGSTGGVINVLTKSGTNNSHGTGCSITRVPARPAT